MTDEGYVKFRCEWTESPPLPAHLLAELDRWRQRLYRARLIGYDPGLGVSYGNLSTRAAHPRQFIITGTGTGDLPALTPAHYTLVTDYDIDANVVNCRGPLQASSETLTHAAVYALDEAVRAVVHAHSLPLWERLSLTVPTTRRDASYGTPAMALEFRRLFQETDVARRRIAVMGGHEAGLVSFGESVAEAAGRLLACQDGISEAAPAPSGPARSQKP
jgi:hypothetical protein